MASLITLKRRIGSIRGTRQITKAMELVSASKLRRAQERARMTRDYRQATYDLLARLSASQDVAEHPLFQRRPVRTRLYIVITSNSGLAGAYNANALKLLTQSITQDRRDNVQSAVIAIGSKGGQFVRRLHDVQLEAYYPAFGDDPKQADLQPILQSIIEQYTSGVIDNVTVIYTFAKSGITQEARSLSLLPAVYDASTAPLSTALTFEPDAETVIRGVVVRLLQVQLWQVVLESLASEHAMRMLAMKSATDNASDLIGDYTLEYNTARQAAITQELSEITGGAEALKD